jgi:dTDP-glucose 4,6-dehydratase
MKVAILGAGGCFGNWTARCLLEAGYEVVGSGRSARKGAAFTVGAEYPYRAYVIGPDNEFLLDWLDAERPEVIVNYAAQGEGAASFSPRKHQKYFYQTNCVALVDLVAQLAERPWLTRFVQIGTSELYGSVERPSKETDAIVPTSPYAASKAAFDLHLMAVAKVQGFPMNIIRPSNCYVPGQQLHRVIPKAMLCGVTGRKLPLQGGGRAEKSYLHGTDLVRAIQVVMDRGPLGEVYNCGPDEPTSIREVVERCATRLGMGFSELCEMAPDREGQDSRYWLDSSKLKALGWSQTVDWDTGLDEMAHWIRAYPELHTMPTDFRMRA